MAPPKLTPAQKAAASQDSQSTSQQSLENDPYNLNSSGTGVLGGVLIPGANQFFFGTDYSTNTFMASGVPSFVTGQGAKLPQLTATQSVQAFTHLSGPTLANIQSQMYRAGLYSGNYQPVLGQLHPEDINAFRSLIIGLASNPSQADLPNYLTQAALDGDKNGVNARQKQPLVVQLKSADDIRAVLQSGSQAIYGKYLSDADINKFVDAYHAQQTAFQTASYAQGGYNPETGQQDVSGAISTGGSVTAPPTTAEGIGSQFERQMFADHPTETGESVFSSKLNTILDALHGRS